MTLKAARVLAGMTVQPRRSAATVEASLVVDCTAYPPPRLAGLLVSLRDGDRHDLEILLLDDGRDEGTSRLIGETLAADDRTVSILLPHLRAIPAMGINAALMQARGSSIGYRTGLEDGAPRVAPGHVAVDGAGLDGVTHDRALLSVAGLADPHLLVAPVWREDLRRRLLRAAGLKDGTPLASTDPLTTQALDRDRKGSLYRESVGEADVLDAAFLSDPGEILRFREERVVPFIARHFPGEADLVEHGIAGRTLSLLLRGGVKTAGAEITYGNFAQRFPTLLQMRPVGLDAPVEAEPADDMLVNYRQSRPVKRDLHESFRATGRPVVFAMDDNLLRLAEVPFFSREPWLSHIENARAHISDADMVLLWSRHSVPDVHEVNRSSAVLSTNVPKACLPDMAARSADDGRVRYATLTSHVRQRVSWWEAAVAEWATFFRANADRSRLVLFGSEPELLTLYREWFEGVEYEVRPTLPYAAYRETLARGEFHFVLAPIVDDSQFVRSKCPIKLLEATSAGAVLVASDVTAYETATDGIDCIKVGERPGAWEAALSRSLAMAEAERHAMWRSARDLIQRSFTTESQFLPFFVAHHLARLIALLRARAGGGEPASILVVLPEGIAARRAAAAWADLLRSRDIPVTLVEGDPNCTESMAAACLRGEATARPLAAVLAPSPRSPWVAAARRAGLPCAALADIADVGSAQALPADDCPPLTLVTPSGRVAETARAAGWKTVRRIGLPLGAAAGPAEDQQRATGPVRVALVVGDDAPHSLIDEICEMLTQDGENVAVVAHAGRSELLVVTGNGVSVADAVAAAMAAGRLIVSVTSADADEMVVHRVSGWSTAAGEPPADLIREAIRAVAAGAVPIRHAATATARARSLPDAILHDLVCTLCDVLRVAPPRVPSPRGPQ